MSPRLLALLAAAALCGCEQAPAPTRSLVGEFAAPGAYALAGDTITVWQRVQEPSGAWRFRSYSITPGGTVESLDELEPLGAPENTEERLDFAERRQGFTLPQGEFEAIRLQAALLRPGALGPVDPVGGYGGEAYPGGCAPDKAQPRVGGINFLNKINWGAFILQPGCASQDGKAAAAVMTQIVGRLERAAAQSQPQ